MSVKDVLAEMEYGLSQKRYAISLLHCLGKAMQQDEVILPNVDEAVLAVYEWLDHLLKKDEDTLVNVLQAVYGETTFS